MVQVTLRNEGEEGYKPEFFGDKITFKRTISDKGASAVSIVGESSRAVSGRAAREEGARIQKAFNISVDNPIVILQQEQAKELLRMESSEKLYNFFVVRILLSSQNRILKPPLHHKSFAYTLQNAPDYLTCFSARDTSSAVQGAVHRGGD